MHSENKGFTLIELLVTLTILGILLAVGAPGLRNSMQNSRLWSQANELTGGLNYARAEAVKLGRGVTVCASVDGATCSGNAVWETGWIVFGENNPANSQVDAGETVLRVSAALTGNNTMRSGRAAIRFGPQGYSVGFNDTFRVCDSRGTGSARNVVVSNQGRVTSGTGAASCP